MEDIFGVNVHGEPINISDMIEKNGDSLTCFVLTKSELEGVKKIV